MLEGECDRIPVVKFRVVHNSILNEYRVEHQKENSKSWNIDMSGFDTLHEAIEVRDFKQINNDEKQEEYLKCIEMSKLWKVVEE